MQHRLIFPNHFLPFIKSALDELSRRGPSCAVTKLEIDLTIQHSFNQLVLEVNASPDELVNLGIQIGSFMEKYEAPQQIDKAAMLADNQKRFDTGQIDSAEYNIKIEQINEMK